MTLARMNTLDASDAEADFLHCCGARRWARAMTARRPFPDAAALFEAARAVWWSLAPADWLEAFGAHPRIGDVESLRHKFGASAAWSAQEQGSVAAAAEQTLQALAEGNRRYEAKFGHIFIVCATGKSAAEMLALLQARLDHDAETELRVAAGEQEKITQLRLQRLVS